MTDYCLLNPLTLDQTHHATNKGQSMKNSSGMTLIELSVVMLLIMMAASLTLPLFTGIAQSTRNQITEARVTQIKQAIINVQTVNGTPTVSGFVADVGRLPYCIQELINQGVCGTTTAIPSIGWKGPYIQTSDGKFYDGWGNQDLGNGNFGWSYSRYSQSYQAIAMTTPPTLIPCTLYLGTVTVAAKVGVCDTIELQSYGADGIQDTVTPTGYDADYPAPNYSTTNYSTNLPQIVSVLIQPSDWIIDLSTTGFNVQFNHLPSVSVIPLTASSTISPLPTVSTVCTTPASQVAATFSNGVVTSTCQTPTTVTTSVTCPSGYTAPTSSSTATSMPPAPVINGQTVNVYCENATSNISTTSVTCSPSANLTVQPVASMTYNVAPPSVSFTCTYSSAPTAATSTTPISQAYASGVPVTLYILANDLYGNSIIPIPSMETTPVTVPPTWLLPSYYNQSNTIYYADYPLLGTLLLPSLPTTTPMAVGNWNICAFQSSPQSSVGLYPTLYPAPMTYTADYFPISFLSSSAPATAAPNCSNTVAATNTNNVPILSNSPALYSGTIAVLPRTQPSIAW